MIVLIAACLLTGCNQGEIDRLTAEVDSLTAQNQQLADENNEIKTYVNEVDKLIEEVDKDLGKIVETEVDMQATTKSEDLKDKLTLIGQHIVDSKEKISDLEKKLSSSRTDLKGLKKVVAGLREQVETKEAEIVTLMQEKGVLEADIESMGLEIEEKTQTIADQEMVIEESKKRWYVYDKEKNLKEKGIIKKTGGFLGLGRSTKVTADLNVADFTEIHSDTDLMISIPHPMKKVKLLSNHKMNSYQLMENGDQTTLEIANADAFWAASKFLVIATK
jgi:outer membrane murein-binding lipoprotein Lpp